MLSLAIASVVHVVSDFRATKSELSQTIVLNGQDDSGTDSSQIAEVCHSCSVASYFTTGSSGVAAANSPDVPEGRLVQVNAVSLRLAGPPPKS